MAPTFLVDSMLGTLARWLRITGFDAVYRKDADDEELLEEAGASGRVLLTRDRDLAARATRRGLGALLVEGEGDAEQLSMVATSLGLTLDPENSRCPKCNAGLVRAGKGDVAGQVPEASLRAFDDFWLCTGCGSVYWRGSHWGQIVSTIERAEAGRRRGAKSL